jgi:2-polyprenyl-6-methoxyphenol hydroxylase-like FAD-dependent oxidoreductase
MANVSLKIGAEFTGLRQEDGCVHITYTQDGADQSLSARWVIACDGARSPVRKALNVSLDDLDFEEPWLVVDAEVEGPVSFPHQRRARNRRPATPVGDDVRSAPPGDHRAGARQSPALGIHAAAR